MFDQQNFGHFGAPDSLSSSYGAPETERVDHPESPSEEQSFETSPIFFRDSSTPLPPLKNGATDEQVAEYTNNKIQNLVTEINERIKSQTGAIFHGKRISGDYIRLYQRKKGLNVDGVVGPETYKALGFSAPFKQIRTSSAKKAELVSNGQNTDIIGKKWYQSKWMYFPIATVAIMSSWYIYKSLKK